MDDSVFVSGLPDGVTEGEIETFFGSIGVIKVKKMFSFSYFVQTISIDFLSQMDKKLNKPKIWLFKDRDTGAAKGEATITYDDPSAASAAIQWFNGQPFNNGPLLKVSMATRKNNFPGGFGRGRGGPRGGGGGGFGGRDSNGGGFGGRGGPRGGGRGGGPPGGDGKSLHPPFLVQILFSFLLCDLGGPGREGDWRCGESSCGNMNFSWRSECNRCKTPRSDLTGGAPGGPPSGGFGGKNQTLYFS